MAAHSNVRHGRYLECTIYADCWMCRYAVSAWHELSEKSQRVARRRYFPGWFFNGLAWLFRRMGSASPRPTAKEYLAPMRMSVSH